MATSEAAHLVVRQVSKRFGAAHVLDRVDLTQHAETAYAEGVHGHLPLRRPGSDGPSA